MYIFPQVALSKTNAKLEDGEWGSEERRLVFIQFKWGRKRCKSGGMPFVEVEWKLLAPLFLDLHAALLGLGSAVTFVAWGTMLHPRAASITGGSLGAGSDDQVVKNGSTESQKNRTGWRTLTLRCRRVFHSPSRYNALFLIRSTDHVPPRKPKLIEGNIGFSFLDVEIEKAAEEFKHALVLKFMKRRPAIDVVRLGIPS